MIFYACAFANQYKHNYPQLITNSISSVSKKTSDFSQVVYKKLQEQGLALLKTKEFTFVNDCFQKGHNAVLLEFSYNH